MKRNWMKLLLIATLLIYCIPQTAQASVSVSARSAVLIEQESGRVLFEKDAHRVSRIASITKIMTAILAIESGKLDEKVKVSEKAVRAEGSSIYLKPGEKIRLEDLVYGLMLRSGNDAAVAIAEHVGGSLDGFAYLMNEKAQQIGMENTHFANPHGLDDHEDHVSTAYDMAILTRYAMKNEIYKEISGTKIHRAPNPTETWDRVWKNKNRLLTEKYKYSTGGKTGYTKRAKRTLVSTAKKDDFELIAVTLNAPDDWNDHIQMFETAFSNFDVTEILSKGKVKGIKDSHYKNKVYLDHSFVYPLTSEEEDMVKVEYRLKKAAPNEEDMRNSIAGRANVYLDDKQIASLPVYYKVEAKEKKSFFNLFKNIFTSIAGIKDHG
ncbi:D-alanyl-D-alanine carboxypeptidase family protein [Mesobacillus selenatarsenatis]|uniref:serine-type D-Ala-D-Ala carboxypeptidase n=1 Tax=Mesobacillus selenatarsenatis (strain DSM 18680 / JCM 14380 / FERM P-15431 / SF-1) TaxID=1321606 RepID=A0A0A8X1K6_MESS1|nr:D-alanyl-D-alanine carboxypeptidase family protein [Mesobacillus selenatarsenatis]GAM13813.1 D-alanyl-D-alanine carboxypeptidase [Mesobacillus selenatarsenatis SF-1]